MPICCSKTLTSITLEIDIPVEGIFIDSSALSQTSPGLRVCSASLLKTLWEKEKLLVTSNFSFSHSVFYPFEELSIIFIKFEIVVCKLFQYGSV